VVYDTVRGGDWYILENKARVEAVGRVSPNAITSWAWIGR
jgi:hypothetical protein